MVTAANSFSDKNHIKPLGWFGLVFARTISSYLDEVEQLEKTVGQDALVAEAQCIIHTAKSTVTQC